MEVIKPTSPKPSFDFNSAPSSPRRFVECFFSAPTSPSRLSQFYCEFDRLSTMDDKEGDFYFDFYQPSEKTHQLSADELFDGGKIKPLKPPPLSQVVDGIDEKTPFLSSSRSLKWPLSRGKKIVQAFSPRKKKHPFETATERSGENTENRRGRVWSSKNSSRRTTRSLSPYRVSEFALEEEEQREKQDQNDEITSSNHSSLSSKLSSSSRKWKLKDLLLFRSASEGHNKDPFRKYSSLFFRKREDNYNKNSSFTSKDSFGAERCKRKVSAHELHYKTNKAASENTKKKTFLPYKQGILGKIAFNSNGF